jgi:hypothetical protein
MPRSDTGRKRCAIYTRKSSEEGLEQEFNSLAAQREACEAYIRSQQHEGWVLAKNRYDDGGVSGGNLERPALPFPYQPGSGLQLGTSAQPRLSGLLELLCNLVELAPPPRTQPAKSDFLHPVCDSSHEQIAVEMRRCLGFVENAPLLTKLPEIKLGEARERLPASRCILDHAAHACAGGAMR